MTRAVRVALLLVVVAALLAVPEALGYGHQSPFVVTLDGPQSVPCNQTATFTATVTVVATGGPAKGQQVLWDLKKSTPGDTISPTLTTTDDHGKSTATVTFADIAGQRVVRFYPLVYPKPDFADTITVTCTGGAGSPPPSESPSASASASPTHTATPTPTRTATATPTPTQTATATPTPIQTPTPRRTASTGPSATATDTPVPATPTALPSIAVTPSPAITFTEPPTLAPSPSPSPSIASVSPLATDTPGVVISVPPLPSIPPVAPLTEDTGTNPMLTWALVALAILVVVLAGAAFAVRRGRA